MNDVFVDAPVLLHAVDDADAAKRDRARAWLGTCWQRRCGRLSTQVLDDFYVQARRRFPQALAQGDARAEVRRYQQWRPWQIDHPTVETAWAVEARYGLPYKDALLVAAAQHMGCAWLLSEHLPHGQEIDSLTCIDPFRVGPEWLDAPAAA